MPVQDFMNNVFITVSTVMITVTVRVQKIVAVILCSFVNLNFRKEKLRV